MENKMEMENKVDNRNKQINVIFIDVVNKKVENRVIRRNLESIYSLLGCRLIDRFYHKGQCVYIDDEGIYNSEFEVFYIGQNTYFGNAVIVGTDEEGNDDNTLLTLEDVKDDISFPEFKYYTKFLTYFDFYNISLDYELENNKSIKDVLNFCSMTSEVVQEEVNKKFDEAGHKNPIHFFNFLANGIN